MHITIFPFSNMVAKICLGSSLLSICLSTRNCSRILFVVHRAITTATTHKPRNLFIISNIHVYCYDLVPIAMEVYHNDLTNLFVQKAVQTERPNASLAQSHGTLPFSWVLAELSREGCRQWLKLIKLAEPKKCRRWNHFDGATTKHQKAT